MSLANGSLGQHSTVNSNYNSPSTSSMYSKRNQTQLPSCELGTCRFTNHCVAQVNVLITKVKEQNQGSYIRDC